jgi:WbqC-like protein family
MYLPYPGFFHKLSSSDIFVIMDDVQYDKRFTNRNWILNPNGPLRLTVPINKQQKFSPNMTVEINNDLPWGEDHWKKVYMCYANAKFFSLYQDYFRDIYKRRWTLLFDLDFEIVKTLMEWLGIRIPVVRESELHVTGEGTERLINACKAVGADTYVSGVGGRNYMDEKMFEGNRITLEYQRYSPKSYPQRFSASFVPNMSTIDMLFNVGPEAPAVIKSSGDTVQHGQADAIAVRSY